MSDIHQNYSHYVRYRITADGVKSRVMSAAPGNWDDDEVALMRHREYEGIFIEFSNSLEFYDEDRDYILNNFQVYGPNLKIYLTKEITREAVLDGGGEDVKWVERYRGKMDYKTLNVKDNVLIIKLTSLDLTELIKSHKDDEIEIGNVDENGVSYSIDDVEISTLETDTIHIPGRVIAGVGEQNINFDVFKLDENGNKYQAGDVGDTGFRATKTKIIQQGPSNRFSNVFVEGEFQEANPTDARAVEAMFWTDDPEAEGEVVDISINYYIYSIFRPLTAASDGQVRLDLVRYKWNGTSYDEVEARRIWDGYLYPWNGSNTRWIYCDVSGVEQFDNITHEEGLMFRWRKQDGSWKADARHYSNYIKCESVSEYEPSTNLQFMFVHDVYERMMEILTGEKHRFFSRFFGRIGIKNKKGQEQYVQDGVYPDGSTGGGLIGLISGYWIRAFDPLSEKYKSPTFSLKWLFDSCRAVFNTGVGVEIKNNKEVLRVENLSYFYQPRVAIKLPRQPANIKRKVDSRRLFSGIEIGYSKGGEYENDVGLDEPNTETDYITPLRITEKKYTRRSEIRGDEYGMESLRRKPQSLSGDEDLNQDKHNWWLDLKRKPVEDDDFEQVHWSDRLSSIPTGINHPESFRSMIFTPLRMLLRHGLQLRAGLGSYINRKIKWVSSKTNSNLVMEFIGESPTIEKTDVLVSELDRARYTEWTIEFEHTVDEEMLDTIYGTTQAEVNGVLEDVPNYYFQVEFINEFGEAERGYIESMKPRGKGKWKLKKANERIINQT
jgi:hypothetical protein